MKRLSFLALLLIAGSAFAEAPLNTALIGKLAVKGYDPVAYFAAGTPVKGDKQLEYEHGGAKYRFAGRENLERFKQDPEKYLPAYGGYCAWAMAQGKLAGIDPEAWSIKDGRLYLNYSLDVREQWLADEAANIARADAEWTQRVAADG